jgi:hypothetical protein
MSGSSVRGDLMESDREVLWEIVLELRAIRERIEGLKLGVRDLLEDEVHKFRHLRLSVEDLEFISVRDLAIRPSSACEKSPGQTPVTGGLIGSARERPSDSSFRTYDPR